MEWLDWAWAALAERWPELLIALLFTGFGRWLARLNARARLRSRLAYELVETQRAIIARAAPARWSEGDPRAVWMLEPYLRRVEFLRGHGAQEGLGERVEFAIHAYEEAVRNFVDVWAEARRRRDGFREAYDGTVSGLEEALQRLRHRRRYAEALSALRRHQPTNETPSEATSPPATSFTTPAVDG